jgi:hypothetical protein
MSPLKYRLHQVPDRRQPLLLQGQPLTETGKVPRHDAAPEVAAFGALPLPFESRGDMTDFGLRFAV